MKQLFHMKWIQCALAILTSAAVGRVHAFDYKEKDLMLVFRKEGFKDVEFNLGSVTNFLGKADGTMITVTNWDLALVQDTYFGSLDDVKFLLVSATATDDSLWRVWLTDGDTSTNVPTDISGSRMSALRSKIEYVGNQAEALTGTNNIQSYVPDSSDPSSYTYIASEGGRLDAATVGGAAPVPVEGINPATNRFFELRISNASTKPPARLIGTFGLSAAGVLKFTAGAPEMPLIPSHIESIARAGNQNTVSFTTISGATYRLRYTSVLGPLVTAWTILPTTVAGDGSVKTLADTTTDAQRFYAVEAFR